MLAANRALKALKQGGPSLGIWQMLPGTNNSRAIARTPGIDWICVDTEHGNIDDAAMHEAVSAIGATGISPIVRIPANEAWMVKRALDAGAHGICVPLIYTPDDARRLVESAKFPPEGKRGFGSPFSMQNFGNVDMFTYLQEANASLVTIVQIETKEALDSVEEIAAVPGVDVLLIGPFDLGNNIGRPILNGVMHDELHAAIDKILKAAQAAGKSTGIFCTSAQQARHYGETGFNMISVATDVVILQTSLAQTVAAVTGTQLTGSSK